MILNKKNQNKHKWKVNEIARDFTLWDTWEFPIEADNSVAENFQVFEEVFWKGIKKLMTSRTFAGFLFSLRNTLSYIFPFDKNVNVLPIPGCRETSVKYRLNSEDINEYGETDYSLEKNSEILFTPVYQLKNESLYEFSNNTVHGLLHLGWIEKDNGSYTANMSIYTKARGIFGRSYLKAIEPFRHLVVYPAMIKMIKTQWQEYILLKR